MKNINHATIKRPVFLQKGPDSELKYIDIISLKSVELSSVTPKRKPKMEKD